MRTKTVLLFQPERFFSKKPAITIKQWVKTPEGIQTGDCPMTRPQLKTWFKSMPDDMIQCLLKLTPAALETHRCELIAQTTYIKDAKTKSHTVEKNLEKHIYTLMGALRRQQTAFWYHEVTMGDRRVQQTKCLFHGYPVELMGRLENESGNPRLKLFVEIGKERYPLHQFQRYFFLLLKDDTYYQLSPKSYEAIQWLLDSGYLAALPEDSHDLDALLDQLGEWDLRIERPALSQENILAPEPRSQVLLTEISGSFLKLEPQFDYEGIIIDGPFEPLFKTTIKGRPVQIRRHAEKEAELVDFLRALHGNFERQQNGFFHLSFAEAQKKSWFLKTYHLLLEKDIALVGIDLLKHFRYAPYKIETTILNQQSSGDFIALELRVNFGREQVPVLSLQKALLNNQKAVLLKDGSLGVFGEEWLNRYGLLLKHGKITGNQLHIARWMLLGDSTTPELKDPVFQLDFKDNWYAKWKQWEQRQQQVYPLPAGLRVEALRPYQHDGYEWMRLLEEAGAGACLADDMGLGKTLQTICFLLHKIQTVPGGKHLIVAPASLLFNWQKEFEKFAPGISSQVLHGNNRDKEAIHQPGTQVYITSYGTMRQDIDILQNLVWETIVLDESHNIKNPQAQTTRAAWQLTAKTKIILSGTPIMNSTADLHSQLHFLMPGLLGSPEFFKREYAIPIEQQANEEKAAVLQKLIRPFLLRRTKEQVASDLPARTESVVWCEMGTRQRMAYDEIKDKIRSNIFTDIKAHGLNKGKLGILAGLTKLRQLCNSMELVSEASVTGTESVKSEILIDELKGIIPQHRALVFSQFTSTLDLIQRDLQTAGIACLRLDGTTAVQERQRLVDEFQSAQGEASVFLLSLKAGNTGLTLTRADYVFLYDPWWNASVENQAIDRTHRIGQEQQVFAYRMICRDSIEEKIIDLAQRKKKLAEDLISVDESLVKSLTMEDLEFLLS
ncbi:hypothetical protein GCM10027051_32230 [Niabella terrae]